MHIWKEVIIIAWLISDTHFNHENIIKYCNRPFDNINEMNNHIINKWNSVVNKDDIVYHLGDFALQSDKEIVSDLVKKLNGNIVLIMGNHDRWGKQKFLDCGFTGVHKRLDIGSYILTHRPLNLDQLSEGIVSIHGHIHNYDKGLDKNKYINVSCEVLDYKPTWIDIQI